MTAIMLLILCFCVFAQSPDVPCPEVRVLGPARMWMPGEPAMFYVLVGNRLNNDYRYTWQVTIGNIEKGQETSSIQVSTNNLDGQNITAFVKVIGLPAGCNDKAAETGSVAASRVPHSDDAFPWLSDNDARNRLDNFFIALQNSPQNEGIVLLNFTAANTALKKRRYLKLILDHMTFRKMDPARLTFIIGENESRDQTSLWRMPKDTWTSPDKDKDHKLILGEYLREELPGLFKKPVSR